jgi:hypothetical protein
MKLIATVLVFFLVAIPPPALAQNNPPTTGQNNPPTTAQSNKPSEGAWQSILVALITGSLTGGFAFGGIVYAQRAPLKRRLNTLRASIRAELTQLIEIITGEIDFYDAYNPEFTWLPVRDYFESYRDAKDIIGLLKDSEAELLTRAMRILEERMGYIVRKAETQINTSTIATAGSHVDLLSDFGPPIGKNLRLNFKNAADRQDIESNLYPILNAAQAALNGLATKGKGVEKLRRPPKTGPLTAGLDKSGPENITAAPA